MRTIALAATAIIVVTASMLGTASPTYAQASSEKDAATSTAQKEAPKKDASTPKPVLVKVQPGDYLSKIADEHGSTWVRLYNANESITNPDVINPGQDLRIPSADEQLKDRPLPTVAAPAAAPTAAYSTAPAARTTSAAKSYPVSGNAAKAFIYARESGNNPNATNPNGCYGIGQDCNGVVRNTCGADYACQDAYFTRYAMGRYGSWEAAYAFWQANHWW